MSKIYTLNNGGSEAEQIPSIGYIQELVLMIENELISQNKDFDGFESIKTKSEELPVGIKTIPEVKAKDVKTDSNHKFISDGILATMVDKPSKYEVERMLEELRDDTKANLAELYLKIVNTPNVINKLRDISTILNEDEIVDGLLNIIACKLNENDFCKHLTSSVHMDNNDRKALNILLKCLVGGFADWNAEDNAYNAIKNKPESLPADGGNADTVSNHGIKDLINKYDYDIVVGDSRQKYSKYSCDIYAENGEIDSNDLLNTITSFRNGAMILFKRGNYRIKLINSCHGNIIFEGVDRRFTNVKTDEFVSISDSVLKHMSLTDSVIYIKSNCDINDVSFTNCKIIFLNSEACNVTNCVFNKCNFVYEGSLMNNIIKCNRFIQTKPIVYLGGNNIISENI